MAPHLGKDIHNKGNYSFHFMCLSSLPLFLPFILLSFLPKLLTDDQLFATHYARPLEYNSNLKTQAPPSVV